VLYRALGHKPRTIPRQADKSARSIRGYAGYTKSFVRGNPDVLGIAEMRWWDSQGVAPLQPWALFHNRFAVGVS
jgi:hypothetical protein